jgi:hypothetical protein
MSIEINVINEIVQIDETSEVVQINASGGIGVPSGGLTNQVLAKNSNTNYDFKWTNNSAIVGWGQVTGTLSDQTDLQNALNLKVPTSRTLTINGVTQDLSANRTYTIDAALPSQTGNSGKYLTTNGTIASWGVIDLSGYVPYTGATGAVNLGAFDLLVQGLTIGKGTAALAKNTALGHSALLTITTGNFNTAVGYESLRNSTTGQYNTAIGQSSLFSNTSGSQNTAIGLNALVYNTTGGSNVAVGLDAILHNTTGSSNTAIGYNAGSHITGGTTPNTTSGTSIYIGRDTRAAADGQSNQIVIGHGATGNGSNTATIGNSSITANYFSGNVTIANSIVNPNLVLNNTAVGGKNFTLVSVNDGTFQLQNAGFSVPLTIAYTGEATFSSSVTANQLIVKNPNTPAAYFYRDVNVAVVGTASQVLEFGARSGSTFISGASISGALETSGTSGILQFSTLNASTLSERMRLTAAGRLLLGTLTEGTNILEVVGTANISSSITANSFVKSGGTSSEILAANGSVITAGTNITISGGTITSSGGSNIYNADGTLSADRTITSNGNSLSVLGGKEILTNIQTGLILKTSTIGKQISLQLVNTNTTTGKTYEIRSDTDGSFKFVEPSVATFFQRLSNGQIVIGNTTSAGNANFTLNGYTVNSGVLQVTGATGSLIGAALDLFHTGGISYVRSYNNTTNAWLDIEFHSKDTKFRNNAAYSGQIFAATGNWLIQTGGTFTDAGFKLDVNGTARVVNKLLLGAGTTASSQINLASSTAPTSPNNGDIWFDGTNLFMRIGGVTKTFTLL